MVQATPTVRSKRENNHHGWNAKTTAASLAFGGEPSFSPRSFQNKSVAFAHPRRDDNTMGKKERYLRATRPTFRAAAWPSSVNTVATFGLIPAPSFFLTFFLAAGTAVGFGFPFAALLLPPETSSIALCSSSENKKDFLPVPTAFAPAPLARSVSDEALPFPPDDDLPSGMNSISAFDAPAAHPMPPVDLGGQEGGGGGGGTGGEGRGGADGGSGGCAPVCPRDHPSAEGEKGSAPGTVLTVDDN